MNFFEAEIKRLEKRIKVATESTDPTRLKCNKLLYELELDQRKEQLEAWRQGKPFSEGGGGNFVAGTLARAMGFYHTSSTAASLSGQDPDRYLEIARKRGLPVDNACDMTSMPFAMKEYAAIPDENLAMCDPHACTPMYLSEIFVSHMSKCAFTYYLDLGFEATDANLEHVTNQIGEFIEYAEAKIPGIRYDEGKLIELQELDEITRGYYYEIYEMLKHRPCPIGGTDGFRQAAGVGFYPDPKKVVAYVKARRDEVAERVAKGIAAVPGEKLRMLWAVTRPFFMDPFKVLTQRKVVIPHLYTGISHYNVPLPRPVYFGGRPLKPLEKIAAAAINSQWGGPGTRWIDNMLWICRDLGLNAIINYNMLGCSATLGLKKLIEDRAEKELAIPVLQLEGKQWDADYASEATINSRLDEFAQMVLGLNGLD